MPAPRKPLKNPDYAMTIESSQNRGEGRRRATPSEPDESLTQPPAAQRREPTGAQGLPFGEPLFIGSEVTFDHGRYRIVSMIRRGNYGSVFKAERTEGQGPPAIVVKLVMPDAELYYRLNEVRKIRNGIHDIGDVLAEVVSPPLGSENSLFCTRFVEGEVLSRAMQTLPLHRTRRAHLAMNMSQGGIRSIATLQRRRLVHCDIKPSNMVIQPSKELPPALIDFTYMARYYPDDQEGFLATERIYGTPEFMPPETPYVFQTALETWDYYSLGRTIEEILRGKIYNITSWCQGEREDLVMRQNALHKLYERYPDQVKEAVGRMIRFILLSTNKEPSARPKNSREASQMLEKGNLTEI